jgi:hypothetical protein
MSLRLTVSNLSMLSTSSIGKSGMDGGCPFPECIRDDCSLIHLLRLCRVYTGRVWGFFFLLNAQTAVPTSRLQSEARARGQVRRNRPVMDWPKEQASAIAFSLATTIFISFPTMLLDPQDQKNETALKGETAQAVTRSEDANSPSQSASAAPPLPTSSPLESEVPPPSYHDSAAASPSNVIIDPDALPESLKTAPRSSRVSQYAQNRSVIATHVLDFTYPVIPTTVPPEERELVDDEEGEGKKLADAFFGSQNGRCQATVAIVGRKEGGASSSTTPPKRVWIVVHSKNGSAKAEIVSCLSLETARRVRRRLLD